MTPDEKIMSENPVTVDPEMVGGTPCFAGQRLPVRALFDNLIGGMNLDEILEEFPSLDKAQAIAALDVACHLLEVNARQVVRIKATNSTSAA